MQDILYLTPAGKAKLLAELEELKGPRRLELAKRLKFAIEQGDLSENADYKAAKEDQGFLEGRIQELEAIISSSVVVENEESGGKVQIGSRVTVQVQEAGLPEETYTIVGAREAKPRERLISYESPIASALMGCRKGKVVDVNLPHGDKLKLKILKVE
ncbi:MAG TPA: transcription elongation factor GreA [Anaerolineaceae bacterium]|nr:transcription elongation factor GreA [Anaerolineaceae bacterium]